jgi:hypothetical protein
MKPACRIITLLLVSFIMAGSAGAKESKDKLFYIINYAVSHCNAEIELNGVLVTRAEKETAYCVSGTADVSVWVHSGVNTFTIKIRPVEKKMDSDDKPSVAISLSTAQAGQMSDEGKKFMDFLLPEKDTDNSLSGITKPVIKQLTFTPSYVPPSELWDKIKPVKLDADARKQIIKLVTEYHTALVRKDAGALSSLLLFASTEMSRIRHQPTENLKNKMRDSFKEMMAEKGFAMVPLNASKLVLKPVVDGRIIWVCDQSGEDPVRTKTTAEGGSTTFPVYVSLIDGKWIIVR